MSSLRALCCLPSVKKQKRDFQVCLVDRARHQKIVEDTDSQNSKRSTKVAKELFADYVKEKNRENLRYFYTFRNKISVQVTVVTNLFSFNV